jgi:D-glycero-alpha-D-manno-heptose-7-phosphate kinase
VSEFILGRAPFRISFGGGGTDVPPYCWEHGGAVVSMTVNKYACAVLRGLEERRMVLRSLDLGLSWSSGLGRAEYDGKLELLKAAVNEFSPERGFELTTYSDLPASSGMGTSSSLTVALIGCLAEFTGRRMGPGEMAELAYHLEREELGQEGGYQDQYAAAFGGLNFMEFGREGVRVTPLRLPAGTLEALLDHLLLFSTGEVFLPEEARELAARRRAERRRGIHSEMSRKMGSEEVLRFHRLKEIALGMRDALLSGDLERFGDLLHLAWEEKKGVSGRITNPEVEALYELARRKGARGGKLLGAGAVGCLLLFCEPGRKREVVEALSGLGARPLPFLFEPRGVRVWRYALGSS